MAMALNDTNQTYVRYGDDCFTRLAYIEENLLISLPQVKNELQQFFKNKLAYIEAELS